MLQVTPYPLGVFKVLPSIVTFNQGLTGLLQNLTLIWIGPGLASLNIFARGGIYQNRSYFSVVSVIAMPEQPGPPTAVLVTAVFPSALQVQWNAPQASLSPVNGYSVQVSFYANFSSIVFSADILSGSNGSNLTGGLIITPSFSAVGCAYVRVFAFNQAGNSLPTSPARGCIALIYAPPAIQFVGLTTLGNEWLNVEWIEPVNIASDAYEYKVEVFAANGSVAASTIALQNKNAVVLPVELDSPVQVAVSLVDPMHGMGPAAGVCLQLLGSNAIYVVPLQFTVSPLFLQAPAGSSSLLVVKPKSPPAVNAWVRIFVLDDFVASVTDFILFTAGSTAQQNVIVSHLRKGTTNITFAPIGGLYRGLGITIEVKTLPSST